MRRLNALAAGFAAAALTPLMAVLDYELIADGGWRRPTDPGALAVFLLVLSIAGFSIGVLIAALWNAAVDGR